MGLYEPDHNSQEKSVAGIHPFELHVLVEHIIGDVAASKCSCAVTDRQIQALVKEYRAILP